MNKITIRNFSVLSKYGIHLEGEGEEVYLAEYEIVPKSSLVEYEWSRKYE